MNPVFRLSSGESESLVSLRSDYALQSGPAQARFEQTLDDVLALVSAFCARMIFEPDGNSLAHTAPFLMV
ncbi:hypothetical protein [Allorhizobium sonneratiae]|uniref:hypothetical protein n=1 Tax=Allorhizobium sonneratiae TaxID=2934936 RepID=UPI00203397DA|nr:hypothetical protein [Allorhizobium sonneratiae]